MSGGPSEILGRHPAMVEIKRLVLKVARTPSTVLLSGESGTGKELVAREIHRMSPRRESPFLIVNCSALPETLLESELFGHEKGAFTGADSTKPGLFEVADGGTLFLDEVADTSPASQAKLLGVLQNQEIRRVGGTRHMRVDVRIITACNRSLEEEVRRGAFRQDLYFRLNTVTLDLPPLRRRTEDVPMMVSHFLRKYGSLRETKVTEADPEVMSALIAYSWPGNVRELEHVIERALVSAMAPLCAFRICRRRSVWREKPAAAVRTGWKGRAVCGTSQTWRRLSARTFSWSSGRQGKQEVGRFHSRDRPEHALPKVGAIQKTGMIDCATCGESNVF